LAGLIETTITKYQTYLSEKQLDADDLSSQFENSFGKY
jgi:heat shock protein HspQ